MTGEEILLAALRAFADRGYDAMSIRELNQQLGVSHNLIFQRFGRKEDLWRAVVDRYFGTLAGQIDEMVDAALEPSADRLEAFRQMVVAFVEANAQRPELLRLMSVEASIDSNRLDYLYEQFIRPTGRRFGRVYQALVDDGIVVELPRGTLFFLLAHGATAPAGHAALAARLGIPNPSDADVARQHALAVASVLIDGVRVRQRQASARQRVAR